MTPAVGAGHAVGEPRFGLLVQRLRLAAGLSQEELAERAGLSRRGISDLERGARRLPHPNTVQRLADGLGLSDNDRRALIAACTLERGPPAPGRTVNHNLPAELSSFVGREREVAEVRRLLSGMRMLTLIGPGGVGKTRLAVRVAASVADNYQDGVWFVQHAALSDPRVVPQAVASALGVREIPGRSLVGTVAAYLKPKTTLLVLDNCEHVVAACAEVADELLRACPSLGLLVTSREPLGVSGELAWRVPSMSVPDAERPVHPTTVPPDLMHYEAIRLFVERARLVQSGFAVTEGNGPLLAHVCRRLDGIPLAIELAAAGVKLLTPQQIAQRLDDCFHLLVAGNRTALPRHQTLRATIDWSYALLSPKEQLLFDRLAVFAGDWTLEAAEEVCADEDLPEPEVFELLGRLVDKSLVMVNARREGVARYRLLETLRQYALEQLSGHPNALARQLGRAGHAVDVQTVDDSPTVEAYDAAVIGSAVYMGKWLPQAEQFVDLHQEQLAAMPVWLFSSGPLGFDDPEPKGEPAQLDYLEILHLDYSVRHSGCASLQPLRTPRRHEARLDRGSRTMEHPARSLPPRASRNAD